MEGNNRKKKCVIIYLLTVILGAAGGFFLFRSVGCSTGSCAVTSNPYISIAFGALFGFLVGTVFCPLEKEKA